MRSVIPIKTAKIINILTSVCLCVFGIIIIAMPDISEKVIGITVGILLIISGVFKLGGYFSKDLFRLAFQYDLQLGIALIVFGIGVLVKTQEIINFVCIVFGISIFVDGLFKASIAFDAKKFGIKRWYVILTVALVGCVAGALLIFFPSESLRALIILLGVSLIWEGILNAVVILNTVKIVKHQMPDNFPDSMSRK
ncbi:MAG: DUF308 domain-containing protein [Clostridia bacterium]|nr:DUF308 domain-containing protein [Clostridia bacterium]